MTLFNVLTQELEVLEKERFVLTARIKVIDQTKRTLATALKTQVNPNTPDATPTPTPAAE